MRLLACFVVLATGCGPGDRDNQNNLSPDACVGLECEIQDCGDGPPTSIVGTVFAPNGTLPLHGVNVYIPNSDPGLMPTGLRCDRCIDALPGNPVVKATTSESGLFVLENVPVGTNIPVVIQSGKWRKQLTVDNVPACTSTTLPAASTTLPKSSSEGDMPSIAITTGGFDALECLVRRLGVADSEFTTDTGPGKVHLYAGNGASQFASGFANSGTFPPAASLWANDIKMQGYDIVMFSCEGEQRPQDKPLEAMNTVKKYADLGGRVFLSHWHNIWIQGAGFSGGTQAPSEWPGIATWNNQGPAFDGDTVIDEVNNPKGAAFADWMVNVTGSTTRTVVPVTDGRTTAATVNETRADRWVHRNEAPQTFQFTTPNEKELQQRCGKVVFTDMHVSGRGGTTATTTPFPDGCSNAPLTPQEKALAFMFFDIATCVDTVIF